MNDTSTQAPPTPTPPRVISGLGDTATRSEAKPAIELDARTYSRALDCVHCGLCLPACPTYTENGLEADSPRGRIHLVKSMADGDIEPTDAVVKHLDLCLDCRACETACPSGVVYHELIEAVRPKLEPLRSRSLIDRFVNAMFFHVFPRRDRLNLAVMPARLLQKLGLWRIFRRLLQPLLSLSAFKQLDKMTQMLPDHGPVWEHPLDGYYPATANTLDGKPRATVALLEGCVGGVLFQDVNRQTINVLRHLGCDVIIPAGQGCCGAIHHHGGQTEHAKAIARANVDAFLRPKPRNPSLISTRLSQHLASMRDDVATVPAEHKRPSLTEPDFIVTNVAGCGAMLKDYTHLLRGGAGSSSEDRMEPDVDRFAAKLRDISELIVELDPPRPTYPVHRKVTYHDACHLAHAQRVTQPPRALLSWVQGLEVHVLPESDMCCGAAGTYNLSQPDMARDLAERKLRHIGSTGATHCVTGNVGCAMQIQSEADRLGMALEVTHPISVLHEAYFGTS